MVYLCYGTLLYISLHYIPKPLLLSGFRVRSVVAMVAVAAVVVAAAVGGDSSSSKSSSSSNHSSSCSSNASIVTPVSHYCSTCRITSPTDLATYLRTSRGMGMRKIGMKGSNMKEESAM